MPNTTEKIRRWLFQRTITRDLSNGLTFSLALILLLCGLLFYIRTVNQLQANLRAEANETAHRLATILSSPVWTLDRPTIQNIGQAFLQNEDVRGIRILDERQTVLFEAASQEPGLIVSAAPIHYDAFEIGAVVVAVSTQKIHIARVDIFWLTIFTILSVTVGVQVGTTLIINRILGRPLKSLVAGLDIIAKGKDYHGLPTFQQQDINQIIERVNLMASQIDDRIQALRLSQENFRQVVTSISDLIYQVELAEPAPVTRFVSPHIQTLTGYSIAQIKNFRAFWVSTVVHPADRTVITNHWQVLLDGGQSESEYRLIRQDQAVIWVRDSARIERGSGRTIVYGVVSDISERKRVEENLRAETRERQLMELELRRYQERLEDLVSERTSELEMINRELASFGYSISHDLRAPLRHIDGYSSIILEEFSEQIPQEAQQYLNRIRRSIRHMSDLIDGLLRLSRVNQQPLTIKTIDPLPIVQAVWDELDIIRAGREIELHIEPLPTCQADSLLLHQIFTNLMHNALKYTSQRPKAVISIGSLQRDLQTIYYVRDNGVGFDMRYAEKLFGIFQRMHSEKDFEGTGIGLALVQRIINRHGGRIWAEAAVDQGACFYFNLPDNPPGKP